MIKLAFWVNKEQLIHSIQINLQSSPKIEVNSLLPWTCPLFTVYIYIFYTVQRELILAAKAVSWSALTWWGVSFIGNSWAVSGTNTIQSILTLSEPRICNGMWFLINKKYNYFNTTLCSNSDVFVRNPVKGEKSCSMQQGILEEDKKVLFSLPQQCLTWILMATETVHQQNIISTILLPSFSMSPPKHIQHRSIIKISTNH